MKKDKTFLKGFVEKVDEKEGVLEVAVATDKREDRDGEIIDTEGMDLKNFKKNPVLLWAHHYHDEPIGKVISIKKEKNRIIFTPKFAVEHSEKARQIFNLYKDKYLNAFSVGFIPLERDGNVFTKTELLEISGVPIPSNPRATVLVREAGSYDEKIIKEIEEAAEKLVEETENEIRVRLRNPADFQDDSFRRISIKKDKPRVFGIIGRLKGETTTTLQSYRFPKADDWTKATASKWASEHKPKKNYIRVDYLWDEYEGLKKSNEMILSSLDSLQKSLAEIGKEGADGEKSAESSVAFIIQNKRAVLRKLAKVIGGELRKLNHTYPEK